MKTIKYFSIMILMLVPLLGAAQVVLDGAYAREHVPKREHIPYQHIREADAMYSKKVLRVIEMTEKINHPLYFPIVRISYPEGIQPQRHRVNFLYLVFHIGILGETYDGWTGELIDDDTLRYARRYPVYELDPWDITNWYRKPVAVDDIAREDLMGFEQIIQGRDEVTDMIVDMSVRSRLDDTRQMTKLWIWEEWVFDRQRSVMDVRIVSIAPDGWVSTGQGETRVWPFWIYYPDYRPLLASHEVFNSTNDAEHKTFDDIFFKRRFTSYIVAETNVYDNRLIEDYLLGIDAIREGERIQDELFKFEHDQWEY
jgi:gliding motility associated protien GldN